MIGAIALAAVMNTMDKPQDKKERYTGEQNIERLWENTNTY